MGLATVPKVTAMCNSHLHRGVALLELVADMHMRPKNKVLTGVFANVHELYPLLLHASERFTNTQNDLYK